MPLEWPAAPAGRAAGRAGGARAAMIRRAWASRHSEAAGQAEAMATFTRRALMRTSTPIFRSLRQRGARIMGAAALTPTPSGSGEADVLRAPQVLHAVEHMDSDVHLGGATLIRMRAQPVADHLFPSADGGLGPGAFRVPGRQILIGQQCSPLSGRN